MADLNSVSRHTVNPVNPIDHHVDGDRHDRHSEVVTVRRATPDEVAYRNGFVEGRKREQLVQKRLQQQMRPVYAHRGMTGGILFGVLLTLTVGFIATALAVFGPQHQPSTTETVRTETVR